MPLGGPWLRVIVSVQCLGLALSVRAMVVAMAMDMAIT